MSHSSTRMFRCISNCVIVETGRSKEPFQTKWVPLTIGEVYPQAPGPEKPNRIFIVDDESYSRSYPTYLFQEVTQSAMANS